MKYLIAHLIDEEIMSTTNLGESNQDFIDRICDLILQEIAEMKAYAPAGFGYEVVDEIEQEVTEIFRKKTYGHYNLTSYRLSILKMQFENSIERTIKI